MASLLDRLLNPVNPLTELRQRALGSNPTPQVAPVPMPTPGMVQQPSGPLSAMAQAPAPLQAQEQPQVQVVPELQPQAQQAQQGPSRSAQLREQIAADPQPQRNPFYARLFAGDPVKGLSAEQNRQLRSQAMLTAGLTILGASGEGASVGRAVAMGVLAGRQATAETAGKLLDEQTVQGRLQERSAVLNNPNLSELDRWIQIRRISEKNEDDAGVKRATDVIKELREADTDGQIVSFDTPAGKRSYVQRGEKFFDPFSDVEVTEGPQAQADVSTFVKDAMAQFGVESLDQLTPEQRGAVFAQADQLRQAGAARTTVNLPSQVRGAAEEVGIRRFERFVEIADQAAEQLPTLNQLEGLIARGVPTGKIESLALPFRQLAEAFDVDTQASGQELLRALSSQLVSVRAQELSGALSDTDIQLLKEQGPDVGNTPEGNRFIIGAAQRVARFRVARAEEAERFVDENGTTRGLGPHLREWQEARAADLEDIAPAARAATASADEDDDEAKPRSLARRILLGEEGTLRDAVREGAAGALPTALPTREQIFSPSPMPKNAVDALALAAGGVAPKAIRAVLTAVRKRPLVAGAVVGAPALEKIEEETGLPVNIIRRIIEAMGIGG